MPVLNLPQFERALRDAVELTERDFSIIVRKVALQSLSGVVFGTRVKTGRARGNWQTTLGTPSEVEDNGATDMVGDNTVRNGASVIAGAPPFGVIWLANNLPYIEFLEVLDHMAADTVTRVDAQFDGAQL